MLKSFIVKRLIVIKVIVYNVVGNLTVYRDALQTGKYLAENAPVVTLVKRAQVRT